MYTVQRQTQCSLVWCCNLVVILIQKITVVVQFTLFSPGGAAYLPLLSVLECQQTLIFQNLAVYVVEMTKIILFVWNMGSFHHIPQALVKRPWAGLDDPSRQFQWQKEVHWLYWCGKSGHTPLRHSSSIRDNTELRLHCTWKKQYRY